MNYSKATNYALHTMLELAKVPDKAKKGVQELAKYQDISPTYLSKILTKLTKSGLVESSPGALGGYSLAKKPDQINFLAIIQAIEGQIPLFKGCEDKANSCKIDAIMREYEEQMEAYLSTKTLKDAIH
ncbi:MAG: RrF2 family transcriptional regulator [Culicoidibacterales bacterium]